jgi:6-pyruvoyltetrahydropterin/6-carboxytetrahydropterin synthase
VVRERITDACHVMHVGAIFSRMPTASLVRRVTFAAAHRYSRPEWSDEKNARVFGACAHPNYHGHSYTCEVTVSAPIDDETGMVIDLGVLDGVLAREVRERFDHRNINLDVPEFADGKLVPTGENLARFIFERVQAGLGDAARVTNVRVAEDESLGANYSA